VAELTEEERIEQQLALQAAALHKSRKNTKQTQHGSRRGTHRRMTKEIKIGPAHEDNLDQDSDDVEINRVSEGNSSIGKRN